MTTTTDSTTRPLIITTALASTARSGEFTVNAELQTFPNFDVVSMQTVVRNEDGRANVNVDMFDHEDGTGSHTSMGVHHATAIVIEDALYGPDIVIRTAAGYSVRIHTFGTLVDGERQQVIVTDERA